MTSPSASEAAIRETGQLYAPNGKQIVAAKDWVPGNAMIARVTGSEDGKFDIEWSGDTRMCWDGQYTEECNGERVFLDEDAERVARKPAHP